jgi:hypothetical protein
MSERTNQYYKEDLSWLAKSLTDPYMNLLYDKIAPGIDAGAEKGIYRLEDARASFLRKRSIASKFTTSEALSTSDSFQTFFISPINDAFDYSNADLSSYMRFGKRSEVDYIATKMRQMMKRVKKEKEAQFYEFVEDNTNFHSASFYANAATQISSTDTADFLDDIHAGQDMLRSVGYRGRLLAISDQALAYLQRNAYLQSITSVNHIDRSGAVDPTITVEWLKNVLMLDWVFVASGHHITDSSDPTDETTTEIWGNKALLMDYQPNDAGDPDGISWMKHLFWRPSNQGDTEEGWIVNEVPREGGGVGITKHEVWNYFTFHSHEKRLAYRIDNLY